MLVDIHKEDKRGNVYTLREPGGLGCVWRDKCFFLVPYGFESDGASVPRFFWRLIFPPGDPKALRAAFAHDYIYRTHYGNWTKAEADRMFYDLLVEDGVPQWRAWLAWLGVALFGGKAWRSQDCESARVRDTEGGNNT